LANAEAATSDLIIFADAANTEAAEHEVAAVRRYLRCVSGFASVRIVERERNLGLANSIIAGVTEVLQQSDRLIVVEDDVVTSPFFLRYMNEALEYYKDDSRVASIHGYVYPIKQPLPESFFLRGADCWGWATWRRGWQLFNPDGRYLLSELRRRKLTPQFDFNGAYRYTKMLERQIAGTNDSWAVRWHASAFLRDKLTLYPGRSLVRNIGNDDSGTHSGRTSSFDVELSPVPIRVGGVPVEDSSVARGAIEAFFRASPDRLAQAKTLVREWLPPGVVRLMRRVAGRRWRGVRFEGHFATWEEAVAASSGYDQESILAKVTEATLKVKHGEAAYERDSVLFDQIQYSWPALAALMWAAARSGGRLSVLDFGGSLGSSYRQNRRFLDCLADVRWGVVEQPHFVVQGRRHVEDERVQFFSAIEECAVKLRPNVIMLGSVLQYLPEPDKVLHELARTEANVMIIDRTPFAQIEHDTITIQRVPPSINEASYPCRILSRERVKRELLSTWHILESFSCAEGMMTTGAGLRLSFEGLILSR
jgi:putative methyltransferase (TIGR04325 family)